MAEIKVGDVVQLKSGGPKMTVEDIGDYTISGGFVLIEKLHAISVSRKNCRVNSRGRISRILMAPLTLTCRDRQVFSMQFVL